MAHEFSEEGRKARFEQWEKLGLDRVKSALQSDPYRRVGSGDVQNLAWEWVRIKEAEMGVKETDRDAALRGLYPSSLDEVLSGRTEVDTALARSSSAATSGGRIIGALKEPERITLVEGLKLLETHVPAEEAKSRLRQAFIQGGFSQAPRYAFQYDEADINWTTGSVKIPRKRDRFCPTFSRAEFNAYFFEEGLARERGGERLMASGTKTMLAKPRAEVEQKIKERIHLGIQMRDQPKRDFAEAAKLVEDVQKWRNLNLDLLEDCFSDRSKRDEYYRSARESYVDASESVIEGIGITEVVVSVQKQVQTLESIVERLEFYEPTSAIPAPPKNLSKVFIVHGHDKGAREAVARFIRDLGFQPIILHERANEGRTVIEKVEAHGDVGFAVVLLTPDDEGCAKGGTPAPRARQNVVLELGYFIGRLGRNRVCALKRGELEIPSDFVGVVYESFDAAGGWKQKLGRELEAVGYAFDWNTVMRS